MSGALLYLLGVLSGLVAAKLAIIAMRRERSSLPPATARQLRAARRAGRARIEPAKRRQFISPVVDFSDSEETR